MKFSEIFNIGLSQSQLDFVDISPSEDTPLFIDPFAISLKQDRWSQRCHHFITHFFQTALNHVREGRFDEAKRLLNGLSEPNETCLGLSTGQPAGRGVAGKQALDLYRSLAESQAARTGLLSDLAECDLFVPGIGSDKISDITTNIIRSLLIEYTQEQCILHGIPLVGEYPSGRFWDVDAEAWCNSLVNLPIYEGKRLILVPKFSVRRKTALNSQEYYSQHVLNFIQQEEFDRGSPLVRVLKSGERRPPSKKTVSEMHPFSKDFLAQISRAHPEVLEAYKRFYAEIEGARGALKHTDFNEDFDERAYALALANTLAAIPSGNEHADRFHTFMIGALEFIFWPNLIYPKKEVPLHDGRKRIDITFTNAAKDGFFYRIHNAHRIASNEIIIECKNYSKDPANPEIDQISGRFGVNRGRLGLMIYRDINDYHRLIQRCRDTAMDDRGFILPIGDAQIREYLSQISEGRRSDVDKALQELLRQLLN